MKPSLMKNAIYKIILNAFNLILPLILGAYVARTLGKHAIGNVQGAETIFNYFFIFATFGVYQYGIRELSRMKHDAEKVSQLFTSLLTISTLTSLFSLAVYLLFIYIGYGGEELFPILVIFGFNFIANIFYVEWANEALERYGFITIKTVVVRLIYAGLLLLIVNSPADYKQYTMLLVLSMVLNNIISFVYIKRNIPFRFKGLAIKQHIRPLVLVVIFSNASILYTQLDRLLLLEYKGPIAVSYYVISQQITGIISMLLLSIIQVSIPRLSNVLENEGEERYEHLLNSISKIYFSILFPAAIGLFVVSPLVIRLYGGKDFIGASSVLAAFSLYMISLGMESILSNQIMYMKQKERMLVWMIFLGGLLNVGFKVVLLSYHIFTPATAILATTLANVLLIAMEYVYVRKVLHVSYHLFDFHKMKYLIYALLFFPITYGIQAYVGEGIIRSVLVIGINGLVYMGVLLATKDEMVLFMLQQIKQRIAR